MSNRKTAVLMLIPMLRCLSERQHEAAWGIDDPSKPQPTWGQSGLGAKKTGNFKKNEKKGLTKAMMCFTFCKT